MKLAKDCIDLGIYTNAREAQLAFWQEQAGLPFEELLKLGGGNHQLRHQLNGSVFKLNHTREPLTTDDPSGYEELFIAREDISDPVSLNDPDGSKVTLVPMGYRGIHQIGIGMRVSNLARFQDYYRNILQIDELAPDTFQWGNTLFFLTEDPDKKPTASLRGTGYRYITVQVWKVDEEHQAYIHRGGHASVAPRTLGSTARISFILDPDDNWIEVSQRASLTGDLSP